MISIVMPVYNTKPEWLEQSIISCLNQTFQNFELIIIDNGSTEKATINTLKRFKNIDKIRIHLCPKKQKTREVARAINAGIKLTKYKYIARMDSDDWMYPARLEKQLNFLENNLDVEVLGTQFKIIQTGHISAHPEIIDLNMSSSIKHWFINHPAVMFRNTVFSKVGLYQEEPEMFPEDLELWSRCLLSGIKMRNLSECLLNYNQHNDNASHTCGSSEEWSLNKSKILSSIL